MKSLQSVIMEARQPKNLIEGEYKKFIKHFDDEISKAFDKMDMYTNSSLFNRYYKFGDLMCGAGGKHSFWKGLLTPISDFMRSRYGDIPEECTHVFAVLVHPKTKNAEKILSKSEVPFEIESKEYGTLWCCPNELLPNGDNTELINLDGSLESRLCYTVKIGINFKDIMNS